MSTRKRAHDPQHHRKHLAVTRALSWYPIALLVVAASCSALDDSTALPSDPTVDAGLVPELDPQPGASDVTPAQLDSVLYQRFEAWRRDRSASNGLTDTLSEYAAKCDVAVGLHVPRFNCDVGTEVPGQGTVPGGNLCDKPNVLNGRCDPGSKFQVLAQNADAAVVAHCRKVGLPVEGSTYNDIAVIQYNKVNGAVCFYQALTNLDGHDVGAPSDGTWSRWISPAQTHGIGCTGCHDNGGFIRSPYLAQLKTGLHVMPSTAAGFDNLSTPLRYVGNDYSDDRSWSVTAPAASCPAGESCLPCTTCHRMAVNNVLSGRGTASDLGLRATAPTQASKSSHSATSPIWMRPGQTIWKQEAESSAANHAGCANAFFASGFTSLPAGCTASPLGQPFTAVTPNPFARGDDLALVGGSAGGPALPVAFSNDDGSFNVTNFLAGDFAAQANTANVQRLTGDFNKDGRMDFALVGGVGWNTIPVALSLGDGRYSTTNSFVGSFGGWASAPGVTAHTGDFNKDGFTDIALTGGPGWTTIPVAFSTGGGSFTVTNAPVPNFGSWAQTLGVRALTGDFNHDGFTDIALTGGAGWTSIPIAFSAGGGSFVITNGFVGNFGSLANAPNAQVLTGDFNKDGFTDIALTGGAGWTSIPIALSAGGGSFVVTNSGVGAFGSWSGTPGARALTGDFNGDGFTDIALIGPSGWTSIPVAFSAGGGLFNVTNKPANYFTARAAESTASVVAGRLN